MPSAVSRRILIILSVVAPAVIAALLLVPRPGSAFANPLTGIAAVGTGEFHACALTTAGGVKCWGNNSSGQLGNGTTASTTVPVDVSGFSSAAAAIAIGGEHSCALTNAGGVKCWGANYAGQLGRGGSGSTPDDVSGLTSGVVAITAGYAYTCALTSAGGVKCWGDNSSGQLGDGTTTGSATPMDVSGLTSGVVAVTAGYDHTCAIISGGQTRCWGRNSYGQLGDGTNVNRTTPVAVTGLTNATGPAAGNYYSCALVTGGGVVCWGFGYGPSPTTVAGLSSGVTALSSLYNHTCALTSAGGVKCWGDNVFGQLGDGMVCGVVCATPVAPVGLTSGATGVSVGIFFSCAVTAGAGVKCWGSNGQGQLGNGAGGPGVVSTTPVDVVVTGPKPTPTVTPCPTQGCPTATLTPTPLPQTALDFSLAASIGGSQVCSTRSGSQVKCVLPLGSTFTITVSLDSLPAGLPAYAGFDAYLYYAGVTSKNNMNVVWPDCSIPATNYSLGEVAFGCSIFAGLFSTAYTGPLGTVDFNCSQSGTVLLGQGDGGSDLLTSQILSYYASGTDILTVNCTLAPTATPRPVGGVSLDAGLDSSGLRSEGTASSVQLELVVALVVAAASLVTIAGMLWRARAGHSPRH